MTSSLLYSITQTRAAGVNPRNYVSFNDVVAIGEFPVSQNIDRITRIEVWTGPGSTPDRVIGIRATYKLSDGDTHDILHGRDTGTQHVINLAEGDLLVGVLGRRNSAGNIGSITFVIFETGNARLVQHGAWGNPPQPGTAFGAFGHIIAFAGTDENAFGLCSLSFIKDETPEGPLLPSGRA